MGWTDLWTYARLSYLIHKTDFASLADRYDAGSTDLRTVTVSVSTKGQEKTVVDHGEVGPIDLAPRARVHAPTTPFDRINWP